MSIAPRGGISSASVIQKLILVWPYFSPKRDISAANAAWERKWSIAACRCFFHSAMPLHITKGLVMSTNTLLSPQCPGLSRENQIFGSASHQMSERARIVAENVKRFRKELGWSQAALAAKAKVWPNTIAQIELGKTAISKSLLALAQAMGKRISDLDPEYKEEQLSIVTGDHLVGAKDLKIFGTGEGGDGIMVLSNEPVDYARRPEPLQNVKDGYGVIVTGESMCPAIKPGDIALIHPHLPARPGDLCLFKSEDHGTFRGTFKEYRGETKDAWKVRRYQPKTKDFLLKKKEWPVRELIVGTYYHR